MDLQRMVVYHYSEEDGAQSDILPRSQVNMFQDAGGSSELFNQDSDTLYVPDLSQASSQSQSAFSNWSTTQSNFDSLHRGQYFLYSG
jgi:hypothetical protein